jgi:hypothetical protein
MCWQSVRYPVQFLVFDTFEMDSGTCHDRGHDWGVQFSPRQTRDALHDELIPDGAS